MVDTMTMLFYLPLGVFWLHSFGAFIVAFPQPMLNVDRTLQEDVIAKDSAKDLKICDVLGGLDLTRLRSSEARALFKGAIEDVELIREYFSEALINGGLKGGLSNLSDLRKTLDWKARNMSSDLDTLTAGLGYSDDREDRRIDRLTSSSKNNPFIGSKASDAAMMDVVSNILPWIVDRKKKENLWFIDHENGRSQAPGSEPLVFDSLYMAGYVLSWGDSIWYYPPLAEYGHPLQIADSLGGEFDSHPIVTGAGFLPDENPLHLSKFYGPYPDIAKAGHALISATAPIYYTGRFMNYTYNNTYIAHTGLDISMDSVSALFADLENRLAAGSFALLVNTTLSPIAISQSVVDKIYPPRTGFEESRVTYQTSDGSIVDDRRNQTYLVADTLHQSLIDGVPSANWSALAEEISHVPRGYRGYMVLNITLTGETESIPYYVMFDRWEFVSDWVLLVLAPVENVDNAVSLNFSMTRIELEADLDDEVRTSVTLVNSGTLDVIVEPSLWPSWFFFEGSAGLLGKEPVMLKAGDSWEIDFVLKSAGLEAGTSVSTVSFRIQDDGYSDCFYDRYAKFEVVLRVTPPADYNVIGSFAIAGLVLMSIVMATSLGFMAWIVYNRKEKIVRCSQPKFLVMLCVGTFIMGSAIVTLSVDDHNASPEAANRACMAAPWLVSMGFIISFSALFSKIWRINKIFHNPRFRRVTVTETDVLVPFAVLFTVNVALLLAWTLSDPLRYKRLSVDSSNPWNTYGTCQYDKRWTISFIVGIIAVNFGAILLACAQAYRARQISDEFSESKWVGITIASWLQVIIVVFPVMTLVKENPTAVYFLRTATIFVVCISLLLFIFVPKIIYHRRHRRNKGNESNVRVYQPKRGSASGQFGFPMSPSDDQMNVSASMTYGIRIVRPPAVTSTQTDTEDALLSRIRELEDRIQQLEQPQHQQPQRIEKQGLVRFAEEDQTDDVLSTPVLPSDA